MKKILTTLLSLIFCLCMGMALIACDDAEGEEHTHTYSTEWTSDNDYHWKKATCEHADEIAEKAEHGYGEDGKCTVCQKEKPQVEDPNKQYKVTKTEWESQLNLQTLKDYKIEDASMEITVIFDDGKISVDMQDIMTRTPITIISESTELATTKNAYSVYQKTTGATVYNCKQLDKSYVDILKMDMSIIDMLKEGFDDATFDETSKTYSLTISGAKFIVAFDNGKIVSAKEENDYVKITFADLTVTLPSGSDVCSHTYASEWTKTVGKHYKAVTCGCDIQAQDLQAHNYGGDTICDDCSYENNVDMQAFATAIDNLDTTKFGMTANLMALGGGAIELSEGVTTSAVTVKFDGNKVECTYEGAEPQAYNDGTYAGVEFVRTENPSNFYLDMTNWEGYPIATCYIKSNDGTKWINYVSSAGTVNCATYMSTLKNMCIAINDIDIRSTAYSNDMSLSDMVSDFIYDTGSGKYRATVYIDYVAFASEMTGQSSLAPVSIYVPVEVTLDFDGTTLNSVSYAIYMLGMELYYGETVTLPTQSTSLEEYFQEIAPQA